MEVILYLSAGVAAIAFCVLVVYLIFTLKALTRTLNHISTTVESVDSQLKGITKETEELLQKTNALADDIQSKSQKLNTVVEAVQGVGTTIQSFNSSLQGVSNTVMNQVEKNQEKISQVVQLGNIIVGLKDKWDEVKMRKKKDHYSTDTYSTETIYHEEP